MISFKNMIGKKDNQAPEGERVAKLQGNIFGQTLNAGLMVKSKKTKYIESKNKKKAYLALGASLMALTLYSVFFFYGNALAYLKAPAEISRLQSEIKDYDDVILPGLEKTKDLHKAAYDKEYQEVIQALGTVFPADIDKLGIIRLFESFSAEVAAAFPPFEFTSINLSPPVEKDGYLIIPAATSIHSSLAGFDRFLSLVDRSGMIYAGEGDEKTLLDKQVRLMSISNISVKYRGVDEETGKDQGVDFSVKLNIYSRLADNKK